MIDYSRRSSKKELLDNQDIPFKDIRVNMRELEFINSYLGGHKITLDGYKILAGDIKRLSICEIGCGGGDNLNAIYKWCTRNNGCPICTGIDINPNCIAYAKVRSVIPGSNFIHSDYRKVTFASKPDIIFSSLFCHHFTDTELIGMMHWMGTNCRRGFFINDLHRHPVAYNFIKWFTKLFSKSYLVKNDAPISVLRGFKKNEWISILSRAGISNYSIRWKWAFRYLIVVKNSSPL